MRLGDYLIAQGKVTKREVDEARKIQKINNHLIGVLAVDLGMMTVEQFEEVLERQARCEPRLLFGETAVACGYLSAAQLETLINIQDQSRLRIGEILILQSSITEQELIEELRAFRRFRAESDRRTA